MRLLVIGRKGVWGRVGTSGGVKVIMGTLGKKSELRIWRVVDRGHSLEYAWKEEDFTNIKQYVLKGGTRHAKHV